MSDGRQYGGWKKMVEVFGPINIRYERRAGKAETWAGFTEGGMQITEFDNNGPVEKNQLLPWAKTAMEQATGIKWVAVPGGGERRVQNLESR